jgi:LacI family transcriptional regulator
MTMAAGTEFVLAFNPAAKPSDIEIAALTPALRRYFSDALGCEIRLVTESNYDALITSMRSGNIDAALLGAYAFYLAQMEVGAEALAVSVEIGSEQSATYQSVVIARRTDPIHALQDLRGRAVGLVDPNSTTGYLMPRRMLRAAGLDPDVDITTRLLASHHRVPGAVLSGEVAAGALHRSLLQRFAEQDPAAAAQLRTIALSTPVPTGPFAVRRDLPRELRQHLLQALLRIHNDAPDVAPLLLSPGSRLLPASSRGVTLKTVAALAGVSYGTVSRVTNGGARVAPDTYERVMDVIRDLGYRPNAIAVSLTANRSDLVGFLIPDVTDPAVSRYEAGLRRVLANHGFHLVLCPAGGSREGEAYYLSLLEDGRFEGLVLTSWSLETPAVSALAAAGRPLVMLNVATGSAPVPVAAEDQDAAIALAVDHLRDAGHARIGAMAQATFGGGFERTIVRGTLPIRVAPVLRVGDDPVAAVESGRRLLVGPDRPTAVVCGTERIAMGLIQAAHDEGIAVPARLSVVALTESWLGPSTTPPITTAAASAETVGEHAAALLVARIDGREGLSLLPAYSPPLLHQRGTVANAERPLRSGS